MNNNILNNSKTTTTITIIGLGNNRSVMIFLQLFTILIICSLTGKLEAFLFVPPQISATAEWSSISITKASANLVSCLEELTVIPAASC